MRARVIGLTMVGLITCALVPAAAAQDSPPALTVAQAKRVVREYNRANGRNNATLDLAGQAAIEGAPIQTIDDYLFFDYQARGERSLGEQAPLRRIRVHVPEQTGYPLQFLASMQIGDDEAATDQLLVFSRPTEGEPWRVTMAAQLLGAELPSLPKTRDGFVRLLDADAAGTLAVDPDQLATDVVDIWAEAAGEERAPSKRYADGPLTTGIVDLFVNGLFTLGVRGNVDFEFEAADEFPVVGYRAEDGSGLVFFVVRTRETLTPISSDGLVQPEGREVFGGALEPGQYGEVRYERLAIMAAHVPPASAKREQVEIIGIYDGAVSVAGDPAGAVAA